MALKRGFFDTEPRYKSPTFREIQTWSANRKKGAGTVFDAALHFGCPAKIIVDVVQECNSDYFYIDGGGPAANEMKFIHDGE